MTSIGARGIKYIILLAKHKLPSRIDSWLVIWDKFCDFFFITIFLISPPFAQNRKQKVNVKTGKKMSAASKTLVQLKIRNF